jgi:hypothetical protein
MRMTYKLAGLALAVTTLTGGIGTIGVASSSTLASCAWDGHRTVASAAWNVTVTPGSRAWNGGRTSGVTALEY